MMYENRFERNSQLSRINEVSFAVDDMLLVSGYPSLLTERHWQYCDELVNRTKETAAGICREVMAL